MERVDSRRLTGPNLQWDRPGAVIEVRFEASRAEDAISSWERAAGETLAAVGWAGERTCVRRYPGGASLAISAPVDSLYAACEVNEAAWDLAVERLGGAGSNPDAATVDRLRAAIESERSPELLALRAEALRRGVSFLADDELATVGLGRGSRTWPVDALPDPSEVAWEEVHDVPVALVTGTNGKTTTVRMLVAIAREAGLSPANTSTDGVQLDGETVLPGDYTGPEGARALLRDSRVGIAFLETARGGLLRRGLPVPKADAACVTNVGHDHFGEYGIDTLEAIAAVKLLVATAVRSRAAVINADDPVLAGAARGRDLSPTWFSLDSNAPSVADDAPCWHVRGDSIGRRGINGFEPVVGVAEVPAALGGAARHNVANALAAAAVGEVLGLGDHAIAAGLRAFRSDSATNPGRGNLLDLGGARVWVDFAHNPEGLRAIADLARGLGGRRVLLVLGQAGDRDDAAIDGLAKVGADLAPDRILLKEMKRYLRGRAEGEVVARLCNGLLQSGYPADRIERCGSEMKAVRRALAWAREGDLLLLLLHSDRARVIELLDRLRAAEWRAGDPMPPGSQPTDNEEGQK